MEEKIGAEFWTLRTWESQTYIHKHTQKKHTQLNVNVGTTEPRTKTNWGKDTSVLEFIIIFSRARRAKQKKNKKVKQNHGKK